MYVYRIYRERCGVSDGLGIDGLPYERITENLNRDSCDAACVPRVVTPIPVLHCLTPLQSNQLLVHVVEKARYFSYLNMLFSRGRGIGRHGRVDSRRRIGQEEERTQSGTFPFD